MNTELQGSHSPGPLVWLIIIAVTCALLFAFRQLLWLVVPFLLALILYYFLAPPTNWLVMRGWSVESATGLVMSGFVALLIGSSVLLAPWSAAHMMDWQISVARYIAGGLELLNRTLFLMEEHWSMLADAHIAQRVSARIAYWSEHFVNDHVETFVLGVGSWLPILLLVPFITFFQLRDGRRFKHFISDAVPNAFFEKTLFLLNEVDRTTRAYFQGLIKLTVLDTLTLAGGLALMGMPAPLALGFICAVLSWVPYVGSVAGGLLVVMVAATDFPDTPAMAYTAIVLFIVVRMLDDFFYMPMTIGRSLDMHPLLAVLMIFIGGAIAGVSGLMLVLPLLGVVMVIGSTIGEIVNDPRLMARHRNARLLRRKQASADLVDS